MAYTDRIREARKRLGMSQADFASQLRIGPSTVSGYETGFREPSMHLLCHMMDILQVDANYLFQDEMGESTELAFAVPKDERELLEIYRGLSEEHKALVIKTGRYLRDTEEMEVLLKNVTDWDKPKGEGYA